MRKKWVFREVEGKFTAIEVESDTGPTVTTQILTDTIEPTWHPATGEHCSSRTGMVKIAKQHGLEELGNDRIPKKEYKPNKEKIVEAIKNAAEKHGIR